MIRRLFVALMLALGSSTVWAADYSVEVLKEPAPSDAISADIAAQLAQEGIKVTKGTSRTVASLWLCKSWPVKEGFKPTSTVLYPFEVGQLIGVIRFKNKGSDFRDQEIASGVYTVRYAQQPVDGNHVGTSVTRDFLVMLPPDQDAAAKPVTEKELFKLSAAAAGTAHPAMLALVAADAASGSGPALRHLEEPDWWILQTAGKTQSGKPLAVDLVIVGKAAE